MEKLMRFKSRIPVSPTCKPNQTKVHGVAKQEKANISCQVDANPPEVQFRWTFNNSAESIDVAASHIARAGTSSIVSYTPMTELDYGTLLCWATNRIGHQQVPCVYHIIPAGEVSLRDNSIMEIRLFRLWTSITYLFSLLSFILTLIIICEFIVSKQIRNLEKKYGLFHFTSQTSNRYANLSTCLIRIYQGGLFVRPDSVRFHLSAQSTSVPLLLVR